METILLINSILLWVVVLFNLLISFRLIQIVAPNVWAENAPKLKKGQIAPSFQVQTMDGLEVTLFSFRNHPVFLTFISLQCLACMQKLPEIQSASSLANQAGIKPVLICDTDQNRALALTKEFALSIPMYIATRDNPLWKQYKVGEVPFYCLIDEKGRVQDTGVLDSDLETMVKIWKINQLS